MAQWETFFKRRPYSERCKKRPSGSALPSAPPTLPPSASASSEAGRPASPPPPSEGRGRLGETEGVPRVVLLRSPLCPPAIRWERIWVGGAWVIRLLLPSRGLE